MQFALLALFVAAILIPGLATKIESTIEGIGGSAFAGPVNTAVSAYLKVALIGAGILVGVYVFETKFAKHEGVATPAAPGAESVVASAPHFNPSGAFTVSKAGPSVSGGINSGSSRRRVVVTAVDHADLLRRRAA